MKKFTVEVLRIGSITGTFYKVPNRKTKRLVIYGLGAPIPPDNGTLPDAPFILDFDVDLFVPDYIGYGRSDGVFTPKNCINTFLNLYEAFTKGCTGISAYTKTSHLFKYTDIYFVGRSFGGAYIPLLPKFNKEITNICLIYPVVNYASQGTINGEETLTDFMNAMKLDGYKHIYRGVTNNAWQKHFKNQDGLSPVDNIAFVKNCNIFVGHGKKDKGINYMKSVQYIDTIKSLFPSKKSQFKLKLYPEGDHSAKTSNKAIMDYLTWAAIPLSR